MFFFPKCRVGSCIAFMTAPRLNEKHKLEPMHGFLSRTAAPHVISLSLGWETKRRGKAVGRGRVRKRSRDFPLVNSGPAWGRWRGYHWLIKRDPRISLTITVSPFLWDALRLAPGRCLRCPWHLPAKTTLVLLHSGSAGNLINVQPSNGIRSQKEPLRPPEGARASAFQKHRGF